MADSIKERIAKNLETALQTLVPAQLVSARRFSSVYLSYANLPIAILHQGDDRIVAESFPLVHRIGTFSVVLIARMATTETRSDDEVLNELERQVIEQVMIDRTRGGNATHTRHTNTSPIPVEEGQPESSILIDFEVDYRHREGAPDQL